MSLRQLVVGLQRLSLTSTPLTSLSSRLSLPLCQTHRHIHAGQPCNRRMDSHAHPPNKLPSKKTSRWEPVKSFKERYGYTTDRLPFPSTGGRGPNGRIWVHRKGGGTKKIFYMVDFNRGGTASGKPKVEKVDRIIKDWNRSGHIAMVASGEDKRWIVATQNMKEGDLIRSSQAVTQTTVRASEGDSYPLGSLPIGSLVNCVERFPGEGGLVARAAGVQAQLVRKFDEKCVVRMPSKREICVSNRCLATLGRVSNIDHNKRVMGKAGANRWRGIRPKSGRWHRKTGRFGRKIKPVKKMATYDTPSSKCPAPIRYTVGALHT